MFLNETLTNLYTLLLTEDERDFLETGVVWYGDSDGFNVELSTTRSVLVLPEHEGHGLLGW